MVGPDRIVLYKSDPCGYCSAALRFLEQRKGQIVEVVDLTGDWEARQALRERTGLRTVPQIWIGETHVGGYDEMRGLDASGGLDPLLEAVHKARS